MDILELHARPDLNLNIKTEISNIARHNGGKFCPICEELIDMIARNMFEETFEDIYQEIEFIKQDMPDSYDISCAALNAVREHDQEKREDYHKLIDSVNSLVQHIKTMIDLIHTPSENINMREPRNKNKTTAILNIRSALMKVQDYTYEFKSRTETKKEEPCTNSVG